MKHRVVIVGAGFGGMAAATRLAKGPVDVTLIDRANHHLFQPLLYQVASASLSPADIAWPVRRLVRRQGNVTVLMANVDGVDEKARVVRLDQGEVPYDTLILAPGATNSYFGNDHWADHTWGLKTMQDATTLRRRFLLAFEQAERIPESPERTALMTTVIVGGGPTGVELAGALAEVARRSLAEDFTRIDPTSARIVLVEAGERILPAYIPRLSAYAAEALTKLGVDVRLNTRVTDCRSDGVELDGKFLACQTTVWAAGMGAQPVARWLKADADRAGRVYVDETLSVPGHPDIYAVGDCTHAKDAEGNPLPGIAPVAKQQGAYVARRLLAQLRDEKPVKPFKYRNWGNLATIGRDAAVVDWGRVRMKGRPAWWLWGFAHIYFLINLRSRVLVAWQWLWSYITFDRGARLI